MKKKHQKNNFKIKTMKNQNVAQFDIPVTVMSKETMNGDGTFFMEFKNRFKLSLSDCGQDRGFEAMLIDFDSKSSDAKHKTDDGKFVRFIDISDFRFWNIDELQSAIKDAKSKVKKIIKEEVFKDNFNAIGFGIILKI